MASDWRKYKLGNILKFGNGKSRPPLFDSGNYAVYGSNGIIGFSDETNSEENTIVIGRVGSYCGSLFLSKKKCWVTDNAIRATRLGGNDASFLYYLMSTLDLNGMRAGSGQPLLNQNILSGIEVLVPVPEEQRAIAHILGTLDDKIELNRKMNETLEAMARALFQSWFVDFDPVRAKAEGRPTGLPAHIDALFPDSFQNSPLGDIPKGWRVGSLSDVAFLNPESWSRTTKPEIIRYIDLANTKWGRIEAITVYSKEDAPSRAQRVLRCGDTIVGTVRPGNGSYALIAEDGLTGSTGFAVLRPRKSECREFIYLTATAQDNIESLAHLADGGAYPAVRPEIVIAKLIVMPPNAVIANFAKLTEPLISRLAQGERESNTLVALRDTLLPKLISGELRVMANKDAVINR